MVGAGSALRSILDGSHATVWDAGGAFASILGGRVGYRIWNVGQPLSVWQRAYWITAFVFGAVFPTLVALLLVLPLKGQPIGGGWRAPLLLTAPLINGAWGIGTGVILNALSA